MTTERIVIVGGPRTGKSWLAAEIQNSTGAPVFCGDPLSKAKERRPDTSYLPEGLAMEDESTRWIVEHWFTMPGPWICEGWIMARALRKWMSTVDEATLESDFPCDRVIVFEDQREDCELKRGQVSMHKAVMTVWYEISDYFERIAEHR